MERVDDCVNFLLGKAYQRVSRMSRDALAPYGVTPVQYAALCVLWERDGLSCADLGQRLMLDSATMTGIVDRLETAGLVQRRPDPGDRRINRIHGTETCGAMRPKLDAAMDEVNRQVDLLLDHETISVRRGLATIGDVTTARTAP